MRLRLHGAGTPGKDRRVEITQPATCVTSRTGRIWSVVPRRAPDGPQAAAGVKGEVRTTGRRVRAHKEQGVSGIPESAGWGTGDTFCRLWKALFREGLEPWLRDLLPTLTGPSSSWVVWSWSWPRFTSPARS